MDYLWSPWRMQYIESASGSDEDLGGCIFCAIRDGAEDDRVLARTELGYVVLNKFPYNPGHLLVVPSRHTGEVEDLDDDEHVAMMALLARSIRALRAASQPHGFNVGMNLGRVAGAGIPDHLHWHVVPRWKGDMNFMTIVGETRVLPELVAETRDKLAPYFAEGYDR
jgi:ATP adenylyltransferase